MEWYLKAWRLAFDFSGRARRKEYWMFILFNIIFFIMAFMLDVMLTLLLDLPIQIIFPLYYIAAFFPSLAVLFRRLHDTNRSGWYVLLQFIPLVGPILLFVYLVEEGHYSDNRYGENPKKNENPIVEPAYQKIEPAAIKVEPAVSERLVSREDKEDHSRFMPRS
ncbi:DUF805 domain-containing protein [Poritiphilus flavus]|uniref:DUF805 domain-containing protein n=1 Tax=Poritiphilus flavus TaxID=2697053 RepID=A0A6L9EFN3_9FLAO|nr:DUF805 domain-containing protein [Poritiphilus flavus]NAS13491.1 DUF805 domain-containing protein [Poritiphilus flavus]